MRTESRTDAAARPSGFTPPKPHELEQHFPQLEILDLAGHGGMGAVYKARQRGLDRMVALKILPPEVGKDPSFAVRFEREARALAKLSHPNIVGVHDSGNSGGFYWVLMEYVDGVNLREAIQTKELSPEEALAIVPQICEALQYAHDEGVVHRDIKPENILLDKKGRVKIADFGLARLLGQAAENFTLTGTHQVMGTPKYMAPEQMEGSHEVDHRADIYSLGVVFYEMLTGELPLGRFDAPSQKVQLDVRVDDVVLRTLEKEPSRRYQNASEIKTDVESINQFANMPPYMRHIYGYEYRSKTEILGWPLVHITSGVDPKTGSTRTAKGIIAIGPRAIGGVALGGVACGVFAMGGVAIGMFTFGGVAIGLMLALGGVAVSLGISLGGVALGAVALGGVAIGLFELGGMSGRLPWISVLGILGAISLLVFGITCVFVLARSMRNSELPPKRLDDHGARRHAGGAGCVIAALLLLLTTGGCVLSLIVLLSGTHSDAVVESNLSHLSAAAARTEAIEEEARMRQVAYEAKRRLRERSDAGHWDVTNEGPVLNSAGKQTFDLRPDQATRVNQILQSAYRSYLEAEQQHSTRTTNELGHLVITISEFPEIEIETLEADLWTQLDEVLDLDQQKRMRSNLTVHTGDGIARLGSKRWKPGILGWGRGGARIELWKVGTWFHWNARIKVGSHATTVPSGSAPELPEEFARFWIDETESEDHATAPQPAIDSKTTESQE